MRYEADSGPILPELQWHVRIDLTGDGVVLTRNGRSSDSEVNAGTWATPIDAAALAGLMSALQALACAALRRNEPADRPDGGGSESYTIVFEDGTTCHLQYDPGVTYDGGDSVVRPVRSFIDGLVLPSDAAPTYHLE